MPKKVTIETINAEGKVLSEDVPEYSAEQTPRFLINTHGFYREKEPITQEKKLANTTGSIEAVVLDVKGNDTGLKPVVESSVSNATKFYIAIPTGNNIVPGTLTLKVITIYKEKQQEVTQQFRWGSIVINYNQSSFSPGEHAEISIMTLNNQGQTICNSKTVVTIVAPTKKTTIFSTNDACEYKLGSNRSEYKLVYVPEVEGQHKVKIRVEEVAEVHERESEFLVTDRAAITVTHHNNATHIFPSSQRNIKLTVKTSRPMNNTIRYDVPGTFNIDAISGGGKLETNESDKTTIVWPIALKAGETATLSFTYRAPDTDPGLYFLGLLEIFKTDTATKHNFTDDLNTIFQDKHRWEIIAN